MLFTFQVLFAIAAGLYSLWFLRTLVRVTWSNASEGNTTTGDEVLRIAAAPLGKVFDACVTRPVSWLIDRQGKKQ
jgi:hypothetical protein